MRTLFGVFIVSAFAIGISLTVTKTVGNFGEALRLASFQSASIMSTTGFSTADYTAWPAFCQVILFVLMFIGGSGGSTAGGLKVSRIIISFKSGLRRLKTSISPKSFSPVKLDGKPITDELTNSVNNYVCMFFIIVGISTLLVSLTSPSDFGLLENLSAVATCINNVGPGFGKIGPTGNFSSFSMLSKLVLCFDMLIGRLEIIPLLLVFYPKSWIKN